MPFNAFRPSTPGEPPLDSNNLNLTDIAIRFQPKGRCVTSLLVLLSQSGGYNKDSKGRMTAAMTCQRLQKCYFHSHSPAVQAIAAQDVLIAYVTHFA